MAELRSTIQSVYNVTDGSSMVAYNLVVDHQVHTGALMSSDDQIVVQLNKTVGDVVEQLAFNSDTLTAVYATSGNTGLVWNISGTTAILKCASGAAWKNEDIIISATINNIVVDKERISYSSSTPILELSNDVGSLMYSANGTTKLKNDEVATTSATVYVNGSAVPTAQVQFNWNIIDGVGTSSANTVTVSAININAFKAQAVCTATFNDINYQKVFKIMRNTQGIAGVDGKPGTDGKPGADANVIEVFDIYFWRSLVTAQGKDLPSVPPSKDKIDQPIPTGETGEDKWFTTIPEVPNEVNNWLIYHSVVTWTKEGATEKTLTWSVTAPTLILAYDRTNMQSPESYAQYLTLTNFDRNDALGWSNGKLIIKSTWIQTEGVAVINANKELLFAAGGTGDYKNAVKIGGFWVTATALQNRYASETADNGYSALESPSSEFISYGKVTTDYIYIGSDGIGLVQTANVYSPTFKGCFVSKRTYLTSGSIYSNAATIDMGTIGGWTLTKTQLYNTQTVNNQTRGMGLQVDGGSSSDTYALAIGFSNTSQWNTAPFYVTHAGALTATSASIKGVIQATSGFIGENATNGWSIDSNALKNGSGDNLIFLSTGTTDAYSVTGESLTNLMIRAGANFGVTKDGIMYCQNAKIKVGCDLGPSLHIASWSSSLGSLWTALCTNIAMTQMNPLIAPPSEDQPSGLMLLAAVESEFGGLICRGFNSSSALTHQGLRLYDDWGAHTTPASYTEFSLIADSLRWYCYTDANKQTSTSFGMYITKDRAKDWYYFYISAPVKPDNETSSSAPYNGSGRFRGNWSFLNWVGFSEGVEFYGRNVTFGVQGDVSTDRSVVLYATAWFWRTAVFKASLDCDGVATFNNTVRNSQGQTVFTSSRLSKTDINPFNSKHNVLFDSLLPKQFAYKEGARHRLHYGFILDEVGVALQKAGLTAQECAAYCLDDLSNPNGDGGLRYGEFIVLNTWQIQLLKPRVSALEQHCATLEARVKELEEKYENIQ